MTNKEEFLRHFGIKEKQMDPYFFSSCHFNCSDSMDGTCDKCRNDCCFWGRDYKPVKYEELFTLDIYLQKFNDEDLEIFHASQIPIELIAEIVTLYNGPSYVINIYPFKP